MAKRFGAAVAVSMIACPGAWAQDDASEPGFRAVWFTHADCRETDPDAPGGSRDTAIDVDPYELWYAAAHDEYDTYTDEEGAEAESGAVSDFDCLWVRTSGFATWMDYYHYRLALQPNVLAAYWGGEERFIIESLVDGAPRRSDLAQRHLTVIGRFYDLCAAARAAQRDAGQTWFVLGPCHYGANAGMMLDQASVEEIHDAAPRYILGDANRDIFLFESVPEGDARTVLEQTVRDWAKLVREGPEAYAERYIERTPSITEQDIEDARLWTASRDSYVSYLHDEPRFSGLNLRRAPVEVFRDSTEDELERVVGCICLERSCADRWPLTDIDAETFLGDAACVVLWREDDGGYSWGL